MPQNIQTSLKHVALFADLPEDMIVQIAEKVTEQKLTAREILFREGQEGDTLYFIQSGEVEIYDEVEGKKETTLATLKTGEYFGEMALLEEKPRSASARAISSTSLLTLDRKTFIELMENNPKLAMKMTSAISARLRTSQSSAQAGTTASTQKDSTTKVFISYSRKDKEFVQKLHKAISAKGIETWVDWENIPLTSDWWNEIQTGIEKADAFAFVISPDSLNSEVCGREVQTSVDNHKRLIPILHREPQKGDPMHEKISSHNWVYMRTDEEVEKNLPQMLEIVNTDLGWIRQHTRLRERALEWERAKKNPSFLLQGTDLQNAERWLESAGNKQPQPTPLHIEYIQASRRVSTLRQRALLTYTVVGLGITLILAIVSFVFFLQARSASGVAEAARVSAELNAATAEAANVLAQDSAATAEAERNRALDAQATAVVDRNLAATAQADAEAERNIAATAQAAAEAQAFIARSGRLESLPLTMLNGQLDLALLMSIEAYRFNPSLSSETTLFTAWSHNPELLRYLQGHQDGVLAAAWAPAPQLATGGADGVIILWDNESGLPSKILHGPAGEILDMAWSSDGQLASGDSNGNVVVWNLETGEPDKILTGHTGEVNAISWSPKNQLTSGGEDGNIIVWNLDQGRPGYTLSKETASVLDLDWSPTGILASAASNDTITIWGSDSIEEPIEDTFPISSTQTIPATGLTLVHNNVQTLAWSPDGALASGGFQEIYLWDLAEQQPKLILQGHSLSVNRLAWSATGELASGSTDNTVIVWDLENGRPKKTYRGHIDWVQSVVWSPDGRLASTSLDKTVIIWFPNERAGKTLRGHERGVYSAAYSKDGLLASGGEDSNVILWDLKTGRPEHILAGHKDVVLSVAWSSTGQLASGGVDNQVILWNLERGTPDQTLLGHTAAVDAVAWSLKGQLASSGQDGTVIVWDLASGKPARTLPGNGEPVGLAWSPDEKLTLASNNGTITILDATTFEPVAILQGGEGPIRTIAWSLDGKLASDGENYQVIIWNLETGQPETKLRGHSNTITSLAWSVDGRLASGAEDSSIILWDLEGGRPAFVFRGHTSLVEDVSWTADGQQLASAALDSTVMVWDVTPESWILRNCGRAGRNFRSEEWANFFPEEDYRNTCPQWPVPKGPP